MKIRQCFLKLQLKILGMFFETHRITIILNITVLFKGQFSLIVYQSAIICIIKIFVNYLASKIHEK